MNHPDPTQIREISIAEKKEIMWNVIEPGDPYDIRKSMIAKLPGQKKFMGAHLQLVCLLQAAQIERLCMFLQDYKQKLRESERVVLDRHSYEIQIKQLTEKLSIDEGSRLENEKLKEFIRKQSKQLEEVHRSHSNIETSRKYQDSLSQIQQLRGENNQLRSTVDQLNGQLNKIKIDNQDELNYLKHKCKEQERIIHENQQKHLYEQRKNQQLNETLNQHQQRFGMLAAEIERLNTFLRQKSKQLNEQTVRNKQLQDESKHWREQSLQHEAKIKNLMSELGRLELQNKEIWMEKSTYEQRQSLIKQYESRLEKLSIQVNRLNGVLRKKLNQLEEAKYKNREQELLISNLRFTEQQTVQLRAKFSQITKKMFEYEKQISLQMQEIERVNFQIKRTNDQNSLLEAKLKNTEKQLQHLNRECSGQNGEINRLKEMLSTKDDQLRNLAGLVEDQKRQIHDYDSMVRKYNHDQQQQRAQLSSLMGKIDTVERQLRDVHNQNNALRMTIMEQQNKLSQTQMLYTPGAGSQASPQKKQPMKKNILPGEVILENRQSKEQDIEEKPTQIHNLVIQNDALRQQLNQRDKLITTLTVQLQTLGKSELKYSDVQIEKPKEEMEISHANNKVTFSRIMQELKEANANPQLQEQQRPSQGRSQRGEVARLSALLKSKDIQIQGYANTLQQYKLRVHRLQVDLNNLNRELQNYRRQSPRRLQYTPHSNQSDQLILMRQNIEHLTALSRGKDQQLVNYQNKIKLVGEEVERLNSILKGKMIENEELYSVKNELLNKIGSQDTAMAQYQSTLNNQSAEMERLNVLFLQKNTSFNQLQQEHKGMQSKLTRQLDEMGHQLSEQQNIIANLNSQLDTVNRQLQHKSQLVDSLSDYERNIRNYQSQIDRLNGILRNNANVMENVSEKDGHYLSQIQRLNNLLRMKVEETSNKDKQFEKYTQRIEQLTQKLQKNEQSEGQHTESDRKRHSQSHSARIYELEEEFRKLQIVMKTLRAQNQNLSGLKEKYEDLTQKNRWLGRQIDRLNSIIDQQNSQLGQLRMNYTDNSALEKRINEIYRTTVVLFAQIEALRRQVDEKEEEIKHWKGQAVRSHLV